MIIALPAHKRQGKWMVDFYSRKHRNVVIFITHFWDESCAAQVNKLRAELGGHFDILVMGYLRGGELLTLPDDMPAVFYRPEDIAVISAEPMPDDWKYQLACPRLFDDFPDYDHYWMIEFDVRYAGNWLDLFSELHDPSVDLYGTVIQRKSENPDWYFWDSFTTGEDKLAPATFVKVFTPIMRLSNPAIRAIRRAYARKWVGFYEALWATSLAHEGLKIEDIGGGGSFTLQVRKGRHYTTSPFDPYLSPGTFAYRPSILEGDVAADSALLWHPVKPVAISAPRP